MTTEPARITKLPVTVEAMQFDGTQESADAIVAWATENGAEAQFNNPITDGFAGDPHVAIETLEGVMRGGVGWWFIRGVQGEFYPCEDSILRESYFFGEPPAEPRTAKEALAQVLNRFGAENGSNTPDFILAEYLSRCLDNFNVTSRRREHWYGHVHAPGGVTTEALPTDDRFETVDPAQRGDAIDAAVAAGGLTDRRLEYYRDSGGEFRWRLIHRNGTIVASASQGYTHIGDARHNVVDTVEGGERLDQAAEVVDD